MKAMIIVVIWWASSRSLLRGASGTRSKLVEQFKPVFGLVGFFLRNRHFCKKLGS